ncbi:inositol polyphosphate-5-phosphatase A-like isoform X5 [Gordionus sp. m RMFG-2023]|uniref:inositol polyphosphate-5-phosphatase A-like isoform X5 n=1 Tax=Gordionus sp. m RMFG-2023 TaxID=3053472 RepID=UPI0031FD4090
MNNDISVLLITANVGSVFEFADKLMLNWFEQIFNAINEYKPQFLALHFQEIGGKNFEHSMSNLRPFIENFTHPKTERSICEQYDRYFILCDENYDSIKTFTEKWSRKGFCMTRWRFSKTNAFNFINIHMFHDASNIIAIKTSSLPPVKVLKNENRDRHGAQTLPEPLLSWPVDNDYISPSFYTTCRYNALEFTLNRIENSNSKMNISEFNCHKMESTNIPYFIFGDFNFRLDTQSLIKKLIGDDQRLPKYNVSIFVSKTVQNNIETQLGLSDFKSMVHQNSQNKILESVTNINISNNERFYDINSGISVDENNAFNASHIGNARSLTKPTLILDKKLFNLFENHDKIFKSRDTNSWVLALDKELSPFLHLLHEYPINFFPSYPYEEDISKANEYMKTRCPGWCDRVLCSKLAQSFINSKKPIIYRIIGENTCMGDHKPVCLEFSLKF